MEKRCIIKDCKNKQQARGLCVGCYAQARLLVEYKKEYTWASLEEMAMALPSKKGGHFMKELRKKLD